MSDTCWEKAYSYYASGNFEKAAEICMKEECVNSSSGCQMFLGQYFYEKRNYSESIHWYSKMLPTENGDVFYALASSFYCNRDFSNAEKYYNEAIAKNTYNAFFWLGKLYEHGKGGKPDIDKALEYYNMGKNKGDVMCERTVIIYMSRRGTLVDKIKYPFRIISLFFRTFLIAVKDPDDVRLVNLEKKK